MLSEDGTIETFENDEAGYTDWHQQNPGAFVFNFFGGRNPAFNVLHRSGCTFLWRPCDEGMRTKVPKWCSSEEAEIGKQADLVLGTGMWKRCGVCFRDSSAARDQQPATTPEQSPADIAEVSTSGESVWISGEPAAWIGSGEKEWKQKVTTAVENQAIESHPQWMDVEFRFLQDRLFVKDIDNLLTPILESSRDGGWIQRGFSLLGAITARKVPVRDPSQVGALITLRPEQPAIESSRAGILIEATPERLDQKTVKWSLYDVAYDLYQRRPELRFAPQTQLSLYVEVTINDARRRKSLADLMKPCIDGLEPILGHPSNLLPEPRESFARRLAPQDEMILSLSLRVQGGTENRVAALLSPTAAMNH